MCASKFDMQAASREKWELIINLTECNTVAKAGLHG